MRGGVGVFVLPLLLGVGACGKEPVAPDREMRPHDLSALQQNTIQRGTGVVLTSVTGLAIGLGDIVIDQAVIKEFGIIEDVAGNIIGIKATGVVDLTGGVLGTGVVTEDFTTEVAVISSGAGQCRIVTVDLAPMSLDVLGRTVFVDLPAADVTARGSGALGSLLCALGQLLQGPVGQITEGVRGLVNAINGILI